jgi:urease accessory protein
MIVHQASIHRRAGHWPNKEASGTLTLDFDARHRRRIRLSTDRGEDVLLNLPKAVAMEDGDGLQLDNGRWLEVIAAAEPLVEIRHRNIERLVCIAWHLGNRHLPTEVRDDALRIRPDHVIENMLHGLGADLANVQARFQPEGGAYSDHDHRHEHDEAEHHHE